MFDLTGKVALVTGATGGIGEAIATQLHGQGAAVIVSGTRLPKLEALASKLKDRVTPLTCDLSDREKVKEFAKQAEDQHGQIDIVVNNAGITADNLFMRMSDEDWDKVIAINLTSSFTLSRSLIRGMIKRRFGRIINIASISGIIGNPGQANYAASKAGLVGLTKSIAREVAPRGITVNAIAPGFIQTPMTEALNDKQQEAIAAAIPANVFGNPEDIASAAVYLASDEARYMTGQTLHVNGGMVMV